VNRSQLYLIRVLALGHLLTGLFYLSWRLTQGWQEASLWLTWLFLAAEVFMFAGTGAFALSQMWRRAPSLHEFELLTRQLPDLPYIDVIILRRWDSIETTRQTAEAALRLHYPWHRMFVHIVDIEADEDMRRVATAIPCEYTYVPDPTTDPLDHMLRGITTLGEYWILLEPGQLPSPNFIEQCLPHFYSLNEGIPQPNRNGFVQALLHPLGLGIADHPLQQLIPTPGDGRESAAFLGIGVCLRRQTLESITALDSRRPVTLGCQIHLQGWMSCLCRDAHVQGVLLPLRNRRIALLALLDALKLRPIMEPGTSWLQKSDYLWFTFWSTSGWAYLVYFLVPILVLCTGAMPVTAFDRSFFSRLIPYLIASRGLWMSCFIPQELWSAWRAERQTGAQFFQSIQASIQALQGVPPYREKPSQLSFGPQALLIGLTLTAIAVGSYRWVHGWTISLAGFTFTVAWGIYNLLLLTCRPPDIDFTRTQQPQVESQQEQRKNRVKKGVDSSKRVKLP
jgi:cellulose synthase (UDP-forming)